MDINYYKKYEPIDGKWYINKELALDDEEVN